MGPDRSAERRGRGFPPSTPGCRAALRSAGCTLPVARRRVSARGPGLTVTAQTVVWRDAARVVWWLTGNANLPLFVPQTPIWILPGVISGDASLCPRHTARGGVSGSSGLSGLETHTVHGAILREPREAGARSGIPCRLCPGAAVQRFSRRETASSTRSSQPVDSRRRKVPSRYVGTVT
jgi:hypothetical protein